ncbi:transpeptidase [Syntrophotalea carbinolica DSM 2380]|uniref:Transpeptidase n=1 Tax=Syntrophotalea carbinolica (strain DSM 2380 / NBRC 103641 / GraBd1) TaxID=338963 RepID=Q3A4U0_SYNC1|nr:penicillin-binding transpeptidase domain-containing protein [Syntrophotalea carbinolica]ABA88617.1 transpeptidase [Syntrophotalea carbinolica DSM 2380]
MRKKQKKSSALSEHADWRHFQSGLNNKNSGGQRKRRLGRRICALALLVWAGSYVIRSNVTPVAENTAQARAAAQTAPLISGKDDVRKLLDQQEMDNLTGKSIALQVGQQTLQIETSLDEDLQNYLLSHMDRKNSRDIGIVVMDADTGRVLAMAGYDKTGSAGNPCLRSNFPAASIFKIVTAAASVDHCNYTAKSTMHFNGYKHTLYKRQLTEKTNKYTNTVSFKDAFAQSINPVFGKLGELRLGKSVLEKYADTFRFNEPLNFDLSLQPSHFRITEDPYNWAEIASGFNRDTTISPLHGAVMASAVLNQGRITAPYLVDRILDDEGNTLYHGEQSWEQQAMSENASAVLRQMMQTTIKSGTARKSFRGYRKDKILSQLQIGGKTGSMDNKTHDVRYDWFVGFARELSGKANLTVAVMVAHEKYIGIRASQYARMAITHYFRKLLDTSQQPGNKTNRGIAQL